MSSLFEPNCTASWVQRTKTGQVDSDGADIYADVTVTVAGVFAPGGSTEATGGQDQVTTQPTVFLPSPGPSAIDRIAVDGVTYEVTGKPQDWSSASPFDNDFLVPGFPVVVQLQKVSG